jgi:hypothetical protein
MISFGQQCIEKQIAFPQLKFAGGDVYSLRNILVSRRVEFGKSRAGKWDFHSDYMVSPNVDVIL